MRLNLSYKSCDNQYNTNYDANATPYSDNEFHFITFNNFSGILGLLSFIKNSGNAIIKTATIVTIMPATNITRSP